MTNDNQYVDKGAASVFARSRNRILGHSAGIVMIGIGEYALMFKTGGESSLAGAAILWWGLVIPGYLFFAVKLLDAVRSLTATFHGLKLDDRNGVGIVWIGKSVLTLLVLRFVLPFGLLLLGTVLS